MFLQRKIDFLDPWGGVVPGGVVPGGCGPGGCGPGGCGPGGLVWGVLPGGVVLGGCGPRRGVPGGVSGGCYHVTYPIMHLMLPVCCLHTNRDSTLVQLLIYCWPIACWDTTPPCEHNE